LSISRPDLSEVPVVDNHAHPLTRAQPGTPEELRHHFTEAHSTVLARDHVGSAVYFRWALRQLADALDVEPSEEAVLRVRDACPFPVYARGLVRRALVSHLLVDDGYPPREASYSVQEIRSLLAVPVRRVLRIETLVQTLIAAHDSLTDMVQAFDDAIVAARQSGCVALKSIAAYRTGLRIERVRDAEAREEYGAVRRAMYGGAGARLTSKLLIDYFVARGLQLAAEYGLPVQFHTGYGDPDLDLHLSNPLHLRPVLEEPAWESVPVVLLHAGYPFTAEAAFLCAVYPNAFLDLSFSLPPLGKGQLRGAVETALGTAPASKLMCSSDGTCIPEHYFLGAIRAREVISEALGGMVEGREVSPADAKELGRMVLHDNAIRLYAL